MAPVVSKRRRGQVVERYPYSSFRVEPPTIQPVRTLDLTDLEKRMPGEDLFQPMTVEERQMQMLAEDTDELLEQVDRREEWMCAQVLLNGSITVPSDDPLDQYEFSVNYNFTQTTTLTGAALWSAYTTSNPFMDLKNAVVNVSKNSVVIPDTAVMSTVTWQWFVASQQVQRTLFARQINIGEIRPGERPFPGAVMVARLSDPDIAIWTYNEWFQDPANSYTNQPLIPDGKVIVLLSKAGGNNNRMYCSAVKQMDPETTQFKTYEARRVPRVWADVNDQVRKYSITSKILPAPVDVANWQVLTVL